VVGGWGLRFGVCQQAILAATPTPTPVAAPRMAYSRVLSWVCDGTFATRAAPHCPPLPKRITLTQRFLARRYVRLHVAPQLPYLCQDLGVDVEGVLGGCWGRVVGDESCAVRSG